MKTTTVAWNEFPWQAHEEQPKSANLFAIALPAIGMAMLLPEAAHASGGWESAKTTVLHITDYLSYGVIVYAGVSGLFGHRNRAIDLLLSCGIGTIIITHADDIERFFKSI